MPSPVVAVSRDMQLIRSLGALTDVRFYCRSSYSNHVGCWHNAEQIPDWQSELAKHRSCDVQSPEQLAPPQSTSNSRPFRTPS